MSKFNRYLLMEKAAYAHNMGFEEMVKFYQKASTADIAAMESHIKSDDWDSFKKLIKKVLGVTLK